jgi:diguanylate cyclase (GGDEF)-like protein
MGEFKPIDRNLAILANRQKLLRPKGGTYPVITRGKLVRSYIGPIGSMDVNARADLAQLAHLSFNLHAAIKTDVVHKKAQGLAYQLDFMKDLAAPDNKALQVLLKGLAKEGFPKAGIYHFNEIGEMIAGPRIDMPLSSYSKYRKPRGEKKQIYYINQVLRDMIDPKNTKVKAETKRTAGLLLKELSVWDVFDRHFWKEYGISSSLIDEIRAEMDKRGIYSVAEKLEIADSNSKALQLIGQMSRVIRDECLLSGDLIREKCNETLKAFKKDNSFANVDQVFNNAIALFEDIASSVSSRSYDEAVRLSDQFCKQKTIHSPLLNIEIFQNSIHNFVDAQKDIEQDIENLKQMFPGQDIDYSKVKTNFYALVNTKGHMPIALVLANNHGKDFDYDNPAIKADYDASIARLKDLLFRANNILVAKIENEQSVENQIETNRQLRELLAKREEAAKRSNKFKELSEILIKAADNNTLESSYDQVVDKFVEMLATENARDVNCSIMSYLPSTPNSAASMEILANTKKDEQGNRLKGKVDIRPIAGWVAQNQKNVFIFDGKIYIGKTELDEYEKKLNGSAKEVLPQAFKDELIKIATSPKAVDDPIGLNNHFVCMPIKIKDRVLILSIKSSMLSEEIMDELATAGNTLELTLKLEMKNKDLLTARKSDRDKAILLENQALTDYLTGLWNRRYFEGKRDDAIHNSLKYNSPVSIISVDLDHFKRVNDKYGHPIGDKVLIDVSKQLKDFFNEEGMVVARMGGEEISILLPRYNKEDTNTKAEEIRQMIASTERKYGDKSFYVTISMGISTCPEDYDPNEVDPEGQFSERADKALTAAKAERNKVWMFGHDTDQKAGEVQSRLGDSKEALRRLNNEAKQKMDAGDIAGAKACLDESDSHIDSLR